MTHRLRALLVSGALLGLMAGASSCGPKGQPCPHAGDVEAQDGHVYTCTHKGDGLVWA